MPPKAKPRGAIDARFDDLAPRLLDWYERHARDLPWRVGPKARAGGARGDPYRVWLAEIMLQQTTVPHAARYYEAFTQRWPKVEDLAAARDEDVMAAWAGLGYYARARNLLKCAREVTERGAWPDDVAGLRALPGIGPYTAGAVAALAFDRPAAAVDGNVERVFARLMALTSDWADTKAEIKETVSALVPNERPGEFAEALMDLGATVCTPKRPNCLICPLMSLCAAHAEGAPETYPIKPAKAAKPERFGHVLVFLDGDHVLTERRPDRGLLGGMMGLPGSDWTGEPPDAPGETAVMEEVGEVRHVFTHFALKLTVWRGRPGREVRERLTGTPLDEADASMPSVFRKALRLAR